MRGLWVWPWSPPCLSSMLALKVNRKRCLQMEEVLNCSSKGLQTEKHYVVLSILTPCSAPIKLIHSNRSILACKANGALHCCLSVAPGHSYSWPLIQVFIIFTSHRRGSSNSMSSFMRKQHVYRDNLPCCPLSLVSHLHILTEIYFQHLTVLHHL